MESGDGHGTDHEGAGVTFVPSKGSVVGGKSKEKAERITDSMADLQLAINGLRGLGAGAIDGSAWRASMAAFARVCSVFLRKTVVGDQGRRETRLLDDQVLAWSSLRFDRLRKIPSDDRQTIEKELRIAGGWLRCTRLDDYTGEPRETYILRAAAQGVKLSVEWPLPGAADWTGVPSESTRWPIGADQLFQSSASPGLDCDGWLAQQVVLFDGKGISLKEAIQAVVNSEGAHSANVGRLSVVEGEKETGATKNPGPHILNALTVCGIQYLHLVVIEAALYLYGKLLDNEEVKRPPGGIYAIEPAVAPALEQVGSPHAKWMAFEGGLMISFSGRPGLVCHTVRAVS